MIGKERKGRTGKIEKRKEMGGMEKDRKGWEEMGREGREK